MAHTLYKPVIGQTVFFTDKQRVSIHEAGHSVVYLAVGENVKWTKIWKKTSEWTGETKSLHSDTSFACPETGKTDVLLRKLMAIFAGYYAVYVLLGCDNAKKARDDFYNSQLYADEWFEGEVLAEIKQGSPRDYARILSSARELILGQVDGHDEETD